MSNNEVDWKRVGKFLLQEHRQKRMAMDVPLLIERLKKLSLVCGEFTVNRRMLQRTGARLLEGKNTIVVPACPDYSHEDGKYTFKSLSGGVSLLTQRHIGFLKRVTEVLPDVRVMLLLADHEADDSELCRVVGKSREAFRALVAESVQATQEAVNSLGWISNFMTALIPDLVQQEHEMIQFISSRPEFEQRILSQMLQRCDMYRRINPGLNREQMRLRTITTAAQYMAFGSWAARNHYLVCNHTTTNLAWYMETEVAVLHNPVSVY